VKVGTVRYHEVELELIQAFYSSDTIHSRLIICETNFSPYCNAPYTIHYTECHYAQVREVSPNC